MSGEQSRLRDLARECVALVTGWPVSAFDDADAEQQREAADNVVPLLAALVEEVRAKRRADLCGGVFTHYNEARHCEGCVTADAAEAGKREAERERDEYLASIHRMAGAACDAAPEMDTDAVTCEGLVKETLELLREGHKPEWTVIQAFEGIMKAPQDVQREAEERAADAQLQHKADLAGLNELLSQWRGHAYTLEAQVSSLKAERDAAKRQYEESIKKLLLHSCCCDWDHATLEPRIARADAERPYHEEMRQKHVAAQHRIEALEKALLHSDRAIERLHAANGTGHDGDDESGEHYGDCLSCEAEAARSHIDAALSAQGTEPKPEPAPVTRRDY